MPGTGASMRLSIWMADCWLAGFPPRAVVMVTDWALLHRQELEEDWDRARQQVPVLPIDPLG